MKIALIIAIVLVAVLIVVSSTYSTGKVNPSSEKSVTVTNDSNTKVTSKGSAPYNSVEPNPSPPSKSIGDKSAKDLAPTNRVFTNASTPGSLNNQNNPKPTENKTATGNVAPPDGRIFTGGEGPYAYVPTCSQKERPLPISPLGPND